MIMSLARLEWRRLSRTPLLWTLLASSVFLISYLFFSFIEYFTTEIAVSNTGNAQAIGVTKTIVTPTFVWTGLIGMALIPMFAARLFPEEWQKRSWTLLASSPLSPLQLLMGKYLGLLLPITAMSVIPTFLSSTLFIGNSPDLGIIITATIGVWLCLSSIGAAILFLSTLNRDPLTATALGYGFLLLLAVFHFAGGQQLDNGLYELSPIKHLLPMLEGRFSIADLAYFAGFTSSCLWLGYRQLSSPRLRELT